jgi:hypothetical protein
MARTTPFIDTRPEVFTPTFCNFCKTLKEGLKFFEWLLIFLHRIPLTVKVRAEVGRNT